MELETLSFDQLERLIAARLIIDPEVAASYEVRRDALVDDLGKYYPAQAGDDDCT